MSHPKVRIDAAYTVKAAFEKTIMACKPIYQSCLNCEHFDELNGEICKLAKVRPPARVIAYGCERYEDIEIPF